MSVCDIVSLGMSFGSISCLHPSGLCRKCFYGKKTFTRRQWVAVGSTTMRYHCKCRTQLICSWTPDLPWTRLCDCTCVSVHACTGCEWNLWTCHGTNIGFRCGTNHIAPVRVVCTCGALFAIWETSCLRQHSTLRMNSTTSNDTITAKVSNMTVLLPRTHCQMTA